MQSESGELQPLIGARIQAARKAKRWTGDQLANKLGTTRQQISRMENGTAVLSVPLCWKLADLLDVSFGYLTNRGGPTAVNAPDCEPIVVNYAALSDGAGLCLTALVGRGRTLGYVLTVTNGAGEIVHSVTFDDCADGQIEFSHLLDEAA